jgi:hypothetical protein
MTSPTTNTFCCEGGDGFSAASHQALACVAGPRPFLQYQWPIIRTEGSAIKTPRVVRRPVASISRRSMIRIGETVVVPIRFSLIRCGISEPVTKTASPYSCFGRPAASSTVLPASAVPANRLVAMRPARRGGSSVLTSHITTVKPRGKLWKRVESTLGGMRVRAPGHAEACPSDMDVRSCL